MKFEQFLNEGKLPAFAGFKKGQKVKFNDPKGVSAGNKVKTFTGTIVKDTKGKEDATIDSKEYGTSNVTVPYENIQGVVK